jgi:hypothetical protein
MAEEMIAALNALLEAVRSGALALRAMIAELPRGYLRNEFEKVRRDESISCVGLIATIKRLGGTPRRRRSEFTTRVIGQEDLSARLWLLSRAQMWVLHGLGPLLEGELDDESADFLREMRTVHERNTEWYNRTAAALRRTAEQVATPT